MPPGGMDGGSVFKDSFNWADTYIKYQINTFNVFNSHLGFRRRAAPLSLQMRGWYRGQTKKRGELLSVSPRFISLHAISGELIWFPLFFFSSLQANAPSDCANPSNHISISLLSHLQSCTLGWETLEVSLSVNEHLLYVRIENQESGTHLLEWMTHGSEEMPSEKCCGWFTSCPKYT